MHPLEKFNYCPICGKDHFEIQDKKSKKCADCGFEYYLNPSSAAAAFIFNDQKELLVLRRKHNPGKGMLDLPGGFADADECFWLPLTEIHTEQFALRSIRKALSMLLKQGCELLK